MSDFAPYWMVEDVEGSFRVPLDDPGVAPDAAPTVCVPVNEAWQRILAGCALQVALPASWVYADVDQLNRLMGYATTLVNLIGLAVACVQPALLFDESRCMLRLSLDGGTTYADVPGWDPGLRDCVANFVGPHIGPIMMQDGVTHPPVPVSNDLGTDWLYYG